MNRSQKRTRTMCALLGATALLLTGLVQSAQAVTWSQGDLVLAIYGNQTSGEGKDALINLSQLAPQSGSAIGNFQNLAANPSTTYTFDISAFLNAAGVLDNNPASPAYPLKYTVMAASSDAITGDLPYLAGTTTPNGATGIQLGASNFTNKLINWGNNINDTNAARLIPSINGSVLAFDNANAMVPQMGAADKLNGAFNKNMFATLGNLLTLISGEANNCFDCPTTLAGQATLFANGTFQISGGQLAAVPVPAAVVLFGTGLIGLVGIARRKIFGQTA